MDPSEAGLMLLPMPMPPSIAPGEVAWEHKTRFQSVSARAQLAPTQGCVLDKRASRSSENHKHES
jgi:hypothetical protein